MSARTCKIYIDSQGTGCNECGGTWKEDELIRCPLVMQCHSIKCNLRVQHSTPQSILVCDTCHMGWAISEDPICPFYSTRRLEPTPSPVAAWIQVGSLIALAILGAFILKAVLGY